MAIKKSTPVGETSPTKTPRPKRQRVKRVAQSSLATETETESQKKSKNPLFNIFSKISKRTLIIVFVILVLAGLIYYFKGQLIVATVNGEPISRFALIRQLEKQSGKQTLDSLITKILVLQEAKKQNIEIGSDEIEQEIKKLEETFKNQGQDLNQVLVAQGVTQEELREQIRMQKIVEKIVGKDITVTGEEIEDYLEKNKDSLPKDVTEEIRNQVKKQLEQQKLSEKMQTWIQSLQDNAKINYLLKF